MKALILAGGRGSRLNEFTKDKNKSMINLLGKPLIEYNLEHAFEAGVNEIIIVIGYKGEEIKKRIGEEYKGIKIRYIRVSKRKIKEGLITGIEASRKALGKDDFILMLADEIVINARLKHMIKKFKEEDLFAICGIVFEKNKKSIEKTYTAMVNEKGRAFRLIEKPIVKINNIKGTGYCIFKNEILDYIPKTPINALRNQKELVDMIQVAIDDGKKVEVFPIAKEYVNVNTKKDYELAEGLIKKGCPKILIVHNQMKYFGGAELLIVELANWLTKMGVKNDILTLSKSKEIEKSLINTRIIIPKHNVKLIPPSFNKISDILKAIWIYRKALRKIAKNYDVFNFHDFPTTWALWPMKKPAVWFMNMPPNLWSKPNAGFLLRLLNKIRILADRFIIRNSIDIITVAEESNRIRAKKRYGIDARLIHFGINYDIFSKGKKDRAVKKWNLKNKFIITQSGMITSARNQLESIKAVEKIKEKIPNVLLILTGKGDAKYKKKLGEYIKKKKLEKYILFIGMFEDRQDLADIYRASNIGLFPIMGQGGVLAPFEMLCSGVPIIISEDMETASLTKKENLGIVTKEYSKAILEIYNNYEKYKKQAKRGALFIKKNLTWKQFSDKMIKAFRDARKKYK